MPAKNSATAPTRSGRPSRVEPYPLDRLAARLAAEPASGPLAGVAVTGVSFDSRQVRPGDLYVGLPGAKTHGARFAAAAAASGAVALLTDPAGLEQLTADGRHTGPAAGLAVLVLPDPRRAMATAAAEVYGRPADRLTMFGVTGTNGKTTTSYLLAAGLRAAGRRCGVIGTLGFFVDGEEVVLDRTTVTTPESADLQALLAIMAEQGADSVVMEVSSHALALGRADEICFAVAGFTNFGEDHLDFHGSIEAYFEAKAQLFTATRSRRVVINTDDDRGAELVRRSAQDGLEVATTGLFGGFDAAAAQLDDDRLRYRCLAYDPKADPPSVTIATPAGRVDFGLTLPGVYNVANALTAVAMLDRIGIDPVTAVGGLRTAQVPGRLQWVPLGAGAPRAYVDFAHTPQAVRSVLTELRGTTVDGRLICVVGCGGDRDPQKRRPMGAAAAAIADLVIITDDNPRTEDPSAIRAVTLAGARAEASSGEREVTVVDGGDRAGAIRTALRAAGPGDVIAVLGKGHERGQEVQGRILPFDDVEQLAADWQHLTSGSADDGNRP